MYHGENATTEGADVTRQCSEIYPLSNYLLGNAAAGFLGALKACGPAVASSPGLPVDQQPEVDSNSAVDQCARSAFASQVCFSRSPAASTPNFPSDLKQLSTVGPAPYCRGGGGYTSNTTAKQESVMYLSGRLQELTGKMPRQELNNEPVTISNVAVMPPKCAELKPFTVNSVSANQQYYSDQNLSYASNSNNLTNDVSERPHYSTNRPADSTMMIPNCPPVQPVAAKHFRCLNIIGRGSYGKVMLVEQRVTKQIFAMKKLRKDTIVRRNQVEHTKTERRLLEKMNHPFIVHLYYAFQTLKNLYFVIQFCPGGELFYHLSRCGRFTEYRTCFYAAQIVLAIEHLHKLDVIYRDLKPENVLLDEQGYIRITDFGLSIDGINDYSCAKSLCGTPEYLAPEVLNRLPYGKAVDWWSLGVLIYEMLTGLPPFFTTEREQLFRNIRYGVLRYPPYISPSAQSLIMGLLCRDPTRRLGSGPNGAASIKAEPFFGAINWTDLRNKSIEPPFKPHLSSLTDVSYFDTDFPHTPTCVTVESDCNEEGLDPSFEGFDFNYLEVEDATEGDTVLPEDGKSASTIC